jgi:hypothetical protein
MPFGQHKLIDGVELNKNTAVLRLNVIKLSHSAQAKII